MRQLILKSFYSVRRIMDPNRRKHCFELFGYDFILDQDFNTWLIEVNTNPCLEEPCELLKDYIPRMIEDMLKLTVDHVFPKTLKRRKTVVGKGSPAKNKSKKAERIEPSKLGTSVLNNGNQNQNLDSIKEE